MEKRNSAKDPSLLIKKAKNGDGEAFGELYELYFVPVFRYIFIRVQDKTEAEDLTQTVFLKVFKKLADFRPQQKKSPLNYFFTVARNTVIDYFRKKKSLSLEDYGRDPEQLADLALNPKETLEKASEAEMILKSLNCLTEEQREVIGLKFINDLSNKEIAELLHKSEAAIRQIQSRAIKVLRNYFKDSKML